MIRKKPALRLDPRVDAGFPKKIMLRQKERQSLQSEAIAL
jgi:hypothetical protein